MTIHNLIELSGLVPVMAEFQLRRLADVLGGVSSGLDFTDDELRSLSERAEAREAELFRRIECAQRESDRLVRTRREGGRHAD